MLIFEGAQAAPNNSYQLIVGYRHFKVPLVFCKDFTIFCEGVKEDGNAVSKRLVGLGEIGFVGLVGQIGFVGLVGQIGCVSYNGLVRSPTNGLVEHDGKISPYGPASKLIVICNSTKIYLIFREDCTIFCEGEWLPTTPNMHGDFTYLFIVIGMKIFGNNELIELINSLVGHHKLVELNCLIGIICLSGATNNLEPTFHDKPTIHDEQDPAYLSFVGHLTK